MVSKEEFRKQAKRIVKDNAGEIKYHMQMKTINRISSILYFSLIVLVIKIWVFSSYNSVSIVLLIVMFGLSFFLSAYSGIKKRKSSKYRETYKDEIIKYLLQGYRYEYNKDSYISRIEYDNSPMYIKYDTYIGEDYLKINLVSKDSNEAKLHVCDISTHKKRKDNNGNVYYYDVFDGAFGYVEFNKSFNESIYINCPKKMSKDNLVKLENIEFNEKFKIYCKDQLEARYILTPDIMEDIDVLNSLVLEQCKNEVNISLALEENKMYFSFSGGFKLFDLKKGKLTNDKLLDDFYDDINIILKIIEQIESNSKIFKV